MIVRRQKSCGEELTLAEKLDPSQVVTFMEAILKRRIVCQSVMMFCFEEDL